MKSKLLKIILILLFVCSMYGCNKKESNIEISNSVKPNQKVGLLNYYVDKNYEYKPELRGMLYTENDRKIFINGDINDPNDVIVIDTMSSFLSQGMKEYINSINKKITDEEIKYSLERENGLEIYKRENYITVNNDIEIVNYSYMINIDSYNHIINIYGPKTKSEEINKIVNDLLLSLSK